MANMCTAALTIPELAACQKYCETVCDLGEKERSACGAALRHSELLAGGAGGDLGVSLLPHKAGVHVHAWFTHWGTIPCLSPSAGAQAPANTRVHLENCRLRLLACIAQCLVPGADGE